MRTEFLNINKKAGSRMKALSSVIVLCGVCFPGSYLPSVHAGSFITDENIVFFYGYLAQGGELEADVCIAPGTQNAANLQNSLQNAIRQWNRSIPTTSNVRPRMLPQNKIDLESVLVHELGHCMGLDHPNIGSVVLGNAVNSTASLPGPNGVRNLDAGSDGLFGTADDVRGDDTNTFFFRLNNNPFTIAPIIDLSTYSRDIAQLPAGDLFAANPEEEVGLTARYDTPDSEATMQHNITVRSTVRSLAHDDVATLKLAAAGLDGIHGTSDDYTWRLNYRGISASDSCDINVAIDPAETALASCFVTSFRTSEREGRYLRRGEISLSSDTDWFFNDTPPCSETTSLQQNVWRMVSLPCDVGISTSATVESVIGDDLNISELGSTWAIFAYEYTTNNNGVTTANYRPLTADDELRNGEGYWLQTLLANQSLDVQGEYPSQLDTALAVPSNTGYGWNMAGLPFRFSSRWADTRIITAAGDQLSLQEADPVQPATSGALGETECTNPSLLIDCTAASYAYKYNGTSYDLLSPTAGILEAFDAAWIFAGSEGVSVRFKMPDAELTTP